MVQIIVKDFVDIPSTQGSKIAKHMKQGIMDHHILR